MIGAIILLNAALLTYGISAGDRWATLAAATTLLCFTIRGIIRTPRGEA